MADSDNKPGEHYQRLTKMTAQMSAEADTPRQRFLVKCATLALVLKDEDKCKQMILNLVRERIQS